MAHAQPRPAWVRVSLSPAALGPALMNWADLHSLCFFHHVPLWKGWILRSPVCDVRDDDLARHLRVCYTDGDDKQ